MNEEQYQKCLEKVEKKFKTGIPPAEIIQDLEDFYPEPMLAQAINVIKAKYADEINWDDPTTVTSVRHNWYKGPSETSKRWNHFFEVLVQQGHIGEETLEDLNKSTTRILNLNPSPLAVPKYSSRGLVMGHVQSGKTTNFLGVATKAADEGYRLIIVLSGITNNLRDQTQDRLEAAIDKSHWYMLTEKGTDFKAGKANAQFLLSNTSNRHIAVVKKNKSRLVSLYNWLNSANAITRNSLPVLIIDDECDQATVNAGTQQKRNAINKALQDLIDPNFLPKNSYIGYSATPFANILADTTDQHGIYPKDFVVSLDASPGYFGAASLFGSEVEEVDGVENIGVDILRNIPNDDIALVAPPKSSGKVEAWEPAMVGSLQASVQWFLLATACRWVRGDKNKWSSMMVHTSSNIRPHEKTAELLTNYLQGLSTDDLDGVKEQFESLWEKESNKAKAIRVGAEVSWADVWNEVPDVISSVRVIIDNSRSTDRLDYSPGAEPYPVIVVGGNTLSRGLTLEGLVSSYFLRTSNAYDSLMQMGRWFGYRPNYEDLQRIWMSNEKPYLTSTWFRELSLVEDEIRQQIALYAREGRSPISLGIRIKSLPGMAITAAAKMKSAVQAQIGFGRSRQQTILFNVDDMSLRANIEAAKGLVAELAGTWKDNGEGWPISINAPAEAILTFLKNYSMHPDVRTLNPSLVTKYIENLNSENELLEWNVAIYSNKTKTAVEKNLGHGVSVKMATRSKMRDEPNTNIKTLISLGDMVADKPALKLAARVVGEGGIARISEASLHHQRAIDPELEKVGLLGIYVIDKNSEPANQNSESREKLGTSEDLIGFFLVFPGTDSNYNVTYMVPNLSALETEFEEIDDDPYDDDEPIDLP